MIPKGKVEAGSLQTTDNYKVVSALLILCLHLTAFAVALLIRKPIMSPNE